jgi:hypothetical protein
VEVENSYHISDFHWPFLQCTGRADVGKVTFKSNGDKALSNEFLLKSNGNEALNDVLL